MPKREDYELLWDRYQKEGVPNKISIERFCVSKALASVNLRNGTNKYDAILSFLSK
ncbi:hypothetical protein [uncultured Bacteroides sp.]|uniref:hypothetical protein n=1 Tax=uncultured Bacteroides sp. TaxID=162156 RepID=UPI002AA825F9|nr:hypothetical protein [uncultured Bacteroides sp.]